ncbi:MAG: hypothetical protein KDE53_05200, partial [Caldilineaceae bacterium]|nr:hypothetical protein [Caldilineaceae bacterium]
KCADSENAPTFRGTTSPFLYIIRVTLILDKNTDRILSQTARHHYEIVAIFGTILKRECDI